MVKSNFRRSLTAAALCIVFVAQLAFLCIPPGFAAEFNRVLRPLLYASLAAVYFVFAGRDERPVPKGGQSLLITCIGAFLYFAALLLTGLSYGFGRNILFSGFSPLLWSNAVTVFTAEYLRVRMIKDSPKRNRTATAALLTLVFAFAQLEFMRNADGVSVMDAVDYFFTAVFPALALGGALSYMAFESSLSALLVLRCAYSLSPLLLPYLPNSPREAWAVISCVALFVAMVIYHLNMREKDRRFRRLAKKRRKYQKKPVFSIIASAALIAVMAAFIMRGFVYFHVVVLTDSMTGSLDRGVVVVVEKLRSEDVLAAVGVGDVIHFRHRDIELMHRVIELRVNADGEQVYITKGDANSAADPEPVEAAQILGIPRAYVPYLGFAVITVRNLVG